MPPVDDIERWVKKRKINFYGGVKRKGKGSGNLIKTQQRQTAFVIARSIKKRGIAPTLQIRRDLDNFIKNRNELLKSDVINNLEEYIDNLLAKLQ
jgi:hypothetical protein